MNTAQLLLIDRNDYSASVLLEDLQTHGFERVARTIPGPGLPKAVAQQQPDVVIYNHHFDHPDDLVSCCTARLIAPSASVLAIVAPGPAVKAVRQWMVDSGYIDSLVEKPLVQQRFLSAITELARLGLAARAAQARTARIENLLPEGAVAALDGDHLREEELFETVVVFTDVRRSSEVITRVPPREFFGMLNECLSAQAAIVRACQGSVVKYTGDGMMTIFRGMGRSHLAMRCAMELGRGRSQAVLPYGVGVAEGVVLAGLVGDSGEGGHRRQYDVIGAAVHLAARLCNMAEAGEVVATRSVHTASRMTISSQRLIGPVSVRGFNAAIDCVALRPDPQLP